MHGWNAAILDKPIFDQDQSHLERAVSPSISKRSYSFLVVAPEQCSRIVFSLRIRARHRIPRANSISTRMLPKESRGLLVTAHTA